MHAVTCTCSLARLFGAHAYQTSYQTDISVVDYCRGCKRSYQYLLLEVYHVLDKMLSLLLGVLVSV